MKGKGDRKGYMSGCVEDIMTVAIKSLKRFGLDAMREGVGKWWML